MRLWRHLYTRVLSIERKSRNLKFNFHQYSDFHNIYNLRKRSQLLSIFFSKLFVYREWNISRNILRIDEYIIDDITNNINGKLKKINRSKNILSHSTIWIITHMYNNRRMCEHRLYIFNTCYMWNLLANVFFIIYLYDVYILRVNDRYFSPYSCNICIRRFLYNLQYILCIFK